LSEARRIGWHSCELQDLPPLRDAFGQVIQDDAIERDLNPAMRDDVLAEAVPI
jgi:hypothetical protein